MVIFLDSNPIRESIAIFLAARVGVSNTMTILGKYVS